MSDATRTTAGGRGLVATVGVPLLVAAGAFAGANLRHVVGIGLGGPVGTLAANALGSVLLGVLLYEAHFAGRLSRETRLLLGTGLLSSFTTYSTFVLDAVTATPAVAVGYVLASYGLGFAGVLLGRWIARRWAGGVT